MYTCLLLYLLIYLSLQDGPDVLWGSEGECSLQRPPWSDYQPERYQQEHGCSHLQIIIISLYANISNGKRKCFEGSNFAAFF